MKAATKLLIASIMLLLVTTVSAQAPYYTLDFGDEPLGPWTELEGTRKFHGDVSAPTVVTSPSRTGRSIKLTGIDAKSKVGDCFYYILPEAVTDVLTIETSIYPESNTDRNIIVFASPLDGSPYGDGPSLYFHNEGSLRYFDTSFRVLDRYYPGGQWIDIKLVLNIKEKYYDIYIDDFDTLVARAPFRNMDCDNIQIVGFTMFTHLIQAKPVYVDSLVIY
jgi:hypothetical protein